MNSQLQTSIIFKILQHLPLVEKVLLTGLVVGSILRILHMDPGVTEVAIAGLATVFFLMAYSPINIPRTEDEKFGPPELLGLIILPKVLWLGCSVSAMSILFYLLKLGNDGYKQMLLIGGTTIAFATLLLIILLILGVKHIKVLTPILFRAIPLCLIDSYIFFQVT